MSERTSLHISLIENMTLTSVMLGCLQPPTLLLSPPPPPERDPPRHSVWLSSAPLGGSVGGAGVGVVAVGDSVGLVLVLIVPAAWTSGK
jgi:hypothetical protein